MIYACLALGRAAASNIIGTLTTTCNERWRAVASSELAARAARRRGLSGARAARWRLFKRFYILGYYMEASTRANYNGAARQPSTVLGPLAAALHWRRT
eukprot:6209387-Pleurochrysis_carterae.AAC.1